MEAEYIVEILYHATASEDVEGLACTVLEGESRVYEVVRPL
jgi:hypothetical protein